MINNAHNDTRVTANNPADDESAVISLMDPDIPIMAKIAALPHLIAGGILLLLMSPVLIFVALITGRFSSANVKSNGALG